MMRALEFRTRKEMARANTVRLRLIINNMYETPPIIPERLITVENKKVGEDGDFDGQIECLEAQENRNEID